MKKKSTLILGLAGLITGSSLSLPLEAQTRTTKGRAEEAKIRSEVKRATEKDLPKTLLSLSDKMISLGGRERDVRLVVEGLELMREALEELRRYDAPDVYHSLSEIRRATWLTEADRFALDLYALGLYKNASRRLGWRGERDQRSDESLDSVVPFRWSRVQYAELFGQIFARASAYALGQEVGNREYQLFGSEEVQRLSPAQALYTSVGQSGLAQRYDLEAPLKSFLAGYAGKVSDEAERFWVDFALFDLESEGKEHEERIPVYTQLVERYQHREEVLPRVYQLASMMETGSDTKGAIELLDRFIARYGFRASAKEDVEKLQDQRKAFLQPVLYARQGSSNLIAHRDLKINLRYRHIGELRAKIYRLPSVYSPERLEEVDSALLASLKPVHEVRFDLPDHKQWSYSDREVSLDLPGTGLYHIAFEAEALRGEGEPLSVRSLGVQVTDKFVVKIDHADSEQTRWLDARTGRPLGDLQISAREPLASERFTRYGEQTKWGEETLLRTSSDGLISMAIGTDRRLWFRSTDEADPHSFISYLSSTSLSEAQAGGEYMAQVYTDRSLYLPGQRVEIAGTLAEIFVASERNRIVPSKGVVVEIYEPRGGKVLHREEVQTDAFGRFTSSFTLPKAGLLGTFRLAVRLGDDDIADRRVGDASFEVAEYKRPTFELEMTKPKEGYALGDTIDVRTQVRLFGGGYLSGATLKYEVYHSSYSLWRMPFYRPETLVLSETLTSDDGGQALLRLPLTLPGQEQDRRSPGYNMYPDYNMYRIVLRASSPTGEQQTSTLTISVGDDLGKLSVDLPEYIDQPALKELEPLRFTATSFDGDTLRQRVRYELYSSDSTKLHSAEAMSGEPVDLSSWFRKASLGRYRLRYFVQKDTVRLAEESADFTLYSSKTGQIDADTAPLVAFAQSEQFEHGKPVNLFYSSALGDGYVFYNVLADGKPLTSGMLRPEAHRLGKLTLPLKGDTIEEISADFYTVRSGRLYTEDIKLTRKQEEKKLELRWETFRDRMQVGSKETWSLRILKGGKPVASSLSAWMYDASLDAIAPYQLGTLPDRLTHYYPEILIGEALYDHNAPNLLRGGASDPEELVGEASELATLTGLRMVRAKAMYAAEDAMPMALSANAETGGGQSASVTARTNFAETAFFLPKLQTDKKGRVGWTFTLPESLTRWRLHLEAHTEDLYKGSLSTAIEAYKELSVRPLVPRFALSGDSLTVGTSIRNTSDKPQRGTFVFAVLDPDTGKMISSEERAFDLAPGASSVEEVAFSAPSGMRSVVIRTTAQTGQFADGEQHLLPILPLERENIRTKALTLRGETSYMLTSGEFVPGGMPEGVGGLLNLSFEANPFYLTLSSLPTLGTDVADNSIDLATALYAQGVARRVSKDTQLTSWLSSQLAEGTDGRVRNQHALTSPSDSPWVEQIEADGSKKTLRKLEAYLRSDLDQSTSDLASRLEKLQQEDGSWSWFAGMPSSRYSSRVVLQSLVRLERISDRLPASLSSLIERGWQAEHRYAKESLEELEREEKKLKKGSTLTIPSSLVDYAYLLALSPKAKEQADQATLDALYKRLIRNAHRLSLEDKARASVALAEVDKSLALELAHSLKEHLTEADGALFVSGDRPAGWAWYSYPFSTTVRVLEALALLEPSDSKTLEGIKQWILQQKRGQAWGSSLATADAVYALALGGGASIGTNSLSVALVGKDGSEQTASGTRPMLTQTFDKEGAEPVTLKVESQSDQTLWGVASVHYTAPLTSEVASGNELKVERRYYIRTIQDGKPYLRLARSGDELRVGDRVVVQLYVKVGQAMDFVRLTDPRLGFAEPVDQVARYHWGAGTGYYVEPKDRQTNFYFDSLGAGEYRLEYEQSVVRSGRFHMPEATIQSAYAPEYSGSTGYSGQISILPEAKK